MLFLFVAKIFEELANSDNFGVQSEVMMYSASIVDMVTICCFFEFQISAHSLMVMRLPDVELKSAVLA
jgi:hypothetical protein